MESFAVCVIGLPDEWFMELVTTITTALITLIEWKNQGDLTLSVPLTYASAHM